MLVGGMALGAAGAAALGLALTGDGSYVLLLPGIVLLGLGQGAAWTGMWIVAASGIAAEDQGVASGMASTTLQVGGAVGLALLVALSSGVGHGPTDDALLTGIRAAVFAIAVGLGCGVLLTLIPRKAATAAA